MKGFQWRDLAGYILPLLMLFFLVFSPVIMRFIQKRMTRYAAKKAEKLNIRELQAPVINEVSFPSKAEVLKRVVEDMADEETDISAVNPAWKTRTSFERIERLGSLQKLIVWSEILGPPGGIASRPGDRELF